MKKINPVQKYFLSIMSSFITRIRDYGMYIALAIIFFVFSITTEGRFLGPINFTNLLNQAAYVAVLAVGMTLVIVTRQIDLSVGFLGAFLGAFLVVNIENFGNNLGKIFITIFGPTTGQNIIQFFNDHSFWLIILIVLIAVVLTVAVGLLKGFLVSVANVPSFVVTLAMMFIFKGLLMYTTRNTTIPTSNAFFQSIGIGYLPTFKIGNYNGVALILGALLILLVIALSTIRYFKNIRNGVKVEDPSLFVTKLIFTIAILAFLTYTLAAFRGISYLLLITIFVVFVYHILTTKTVIGRKIYAVGSNPEAAELSGINVKQIITVVFISMGILSLFAGLMFVARTQNASPQHGVGWEMYAIASCYIGGTSANGGVGKVINSAIGAITIIGLTNGMALAGINANLEPIILGSVLVLSVIFDIYTRNVRPIDLVGMYYAKNKYRNEYLQAKKEYKEARKALKEAIEEGNTEKINALEFELTKKQGEFNRFRELIRSAKEEDFLEVIK